MKASIMPNAKDEQPVRVLVGFSRRSASDDLAQAIAPDLARILGRELEILLMPGQTGLKAAQVTIASPADGNTLMIATFGTHAINPNINPSLGYDPIKDFTPVCLATSSPMILAVHPAIAAHSVGELIALAKTGAHLVYGSSAVGGAPYLGAALFQKLAGITMEHRLYDDTRVLYDDLVAGRISLSFNNVMTMLPLMHSGSVRALAVTSAMRSAALPELPTIAEAALPGYAVNNWIGVVAPPGLPEALAISLSHSLQEALHAPVTVATMAQTGTIIVASTPEAFGRHIAEELATWSWLRPV